MAATAAPYTLPATNVPQSYTPIILSGTDASTTVLPGKTGFVIEVWGYDISVSAATNLDFKSGSTDISGVIQLPGPSYYQYYLPVGDSLRTNAVPRCVTADGADLVLTNSGSVTLGGTVWVIQRPTNRTY